MFNNFSYNYKRKYLLCNRKHEKIYGWELLLNALKIVIQKNPNIYLLSLGTGSETNHLKEIANRLDIFKNIYWLGDIPNDLVPLYLNLSDLYISPSISDGTSLSLQEAMACETPIIVYNIPANLEWIKNGENGIIFKKRNKRLLAKLILASIGDDQIRKNFGKKNRAIAEKNFSYKLYLSNIFKAYRELDK
jgi:glycosyltransferase involved in cell wall biosynthesis